MNRRLMCCCLLIIAAVILCFSGCRNDDPDERLFSDLSETDIKKDDRQDVENNDEFFNQEDHSDAALKQQILGDWYQIRPCGKDAFAVITVWTFENNGHFLLSGYHHLKDDLYDEWQEFNSDYFSGSYRVENGNLILDFEVNLENAPLDFGGSTYRVGDTARFPASISGNTLQLYASQAESLTRGNLNDALVGYDPGK